MLCTRWTNAKKMRAVRALALAWVAGCATTSVTTDYDGRADFGRYRTYAIQPGRVQLEDIEASPDSLVRDRIHGALKRELGAKGLEPARAQQADLIVTYAASSQTRPELVETVGGGPDWMYGGYNIFVQHVDHGTLVIDVIDARSGKLVWRSISTAENKDFRSNKFISKAVDKALKKFPPSEAS